MKIISGGQCGVDASGVVAARDCGLETGGWCPKGFRTQEGPNSRLGSIYGLRETPSDDYRTRTWWNVRDSEATLRLAFSFATPGEICTYNALTYYKRPKCDINWVDISFDPEKPDFVFDATPEDVVEWLRLLNIKTLNVAGNSERTAPGISEASYQFLYLTFKHAKELGL